tara:strand:+ start:3870 stop:5159 length:1290 start_codon:yes stop_codon:yes gene_type:complete
LTNKILCGDSLEVLKDFEDNYFDSVVTDPPYGLAFMGKKWDYDVPQVELWKEVYRVLKPGGHILSFAGSRTYHRMAVNIEDAGFEIRDMLGWLYGSGFPKSHNIGKAVDKLQGNKREVVGIKKNYQNKKGKDGYMLNSDRIDLQDTKGNSKWEGWGTALKPAHEPIVMARKPFNTSVAENVLKHGTGGINIDECRVGTEKRENNFNDFTNQSGNQFGNGKEIKKIGTTIVEGRFPANIIHDGSEEVLEIFPETKSGKLKHNSEIQRKGMSSDGSSFNSKNSGFNVNKGQGLANFGDSGSAARFFYCAKASKAERNMGLDELSTKQTTGGGGGIGNYLDDINSASGKYGSEKAPQKNYHPTVKPIKLMEYLVRLVTPKEGIVLEPFAGSGTTLIACKQQGFNYIGIEREQEYCDIAEARLKGVQVQGELF